MSDSQFVGILAVLFLFFFAGEAYIEKELLISIICLALLSLIIIAMLIAEAIQKKG